MLSNKKQVKRQIKSRMNARNNLRLGGTPPQKPPKGLSRNEIRRGIINPIINFSSKKFYKKVFVDYDVVICIPSYERYLKVRRLISQFYEQPTKYTLKIILLNDGSKDGQYDTIIKEFPEIIYIKNNKPNAKLNHWYCYTQMWEYLKDIECHAVLQMDDDFILCDNFLDTIIDIYFQQKEINDNMKGIAPHTWSFRNKEIKHEDWWDNIQFVDGICLIDYNIISEMNFSMQPVDKIVENDGVPVRTWVQISNMVKSFGGYYYRTPESLVYHDGNNDSKLHPTVRVGKNGVFSQKLEQSLKKYNND